jgi:hypothetical protein
MGALRRSISIYCEREPGSGFTVLRPQFEPGLVVILSKNSNHSKFVVSSVS